MNKRSIRLKEHQPNLDMHRRPPESIREESDDSLEEGPHRVRTDDQGFISTGNDVPGDAPDIFVIGDSFVESLLASEHRRFVSQVERGLSAAGAPHRVRNGGYSGMTSLHMLGAVSAKLPPLLRPGSRLLLVVGQSDANALASRGLYWEQTKTVTPFSSPASASNVLDGSWREAFINMVTTVLTFAKLHGYDVAMTSGLFRNGDFDHDPVLRRRFRRQRSAYEASFEKRRFIVDAVRAIAREHSVLHFDVSADFLARPDFFYDALHLNHAGHDAYAAALLAWMLETWLPTRADADFAELEH